MEAVIYRALLIVMGAAITVAYALAPNAKDFPQPESAKIIFFHVPPAMLGTVFFLWAAIQALRFLRSRHVDFDHRALAAVEVGTLLMVLATLTGMVFARVQWGAFWSWDPRQTTILLQLLIYASYFALRSSFEDKDRGVVSANAYAVFAFLTVPFLIYVLPRVFSSLHAAPNQAVVGNNLDPTYRTIFYSSLLVIGLAFLWAYRYRVSALDSLKETTYGLEDRSGDSTDTSVVRPVRLRDMDER
jgi:heme exporter protein C